MKREQAINDGWVGFLVKDDDGLAVALSRIWSSRGNSVPLSTMSEQLKEKYKHFPGDILSNEQTDLKAKLEKGGWEFYRLASGIVYKS